MRVHDVAGVRRDMRSGCTCARSRACPDCFCVCAVSLVDSCCALFYVFVHPMAKTVPLLPNCKEVGLPEVAQCLHNMGYDSPETFRSSLDAAALERWLGKARPKLGEAVADVDDEDWATHPIAGKLRRLWSKCGLCVPTADVPQAPCSALALFGEAAPSSQRLDAGDRERLVMGFE